MPNFLEFIQAPIQPKIIHTELDSNFLYYNNLSPGLKERFVARTARFIQEKKFVSRQELQITDQIRIIISACAIQITFGLDSYLLENFEYILVYPDIYKSPVTQKMHKGETNLNGVICLSWKHTVEGINIPNDNYNLGIHEWMHALRFNGINYEQTDYFFDGYINKWIACALPEYNKIKAGKKSIFRRYAATNLHEFLSVCTEHFFESPEEFQRETPDFFDEMCILLNQIPGKNKPTKIGVRNMLLNLIPKNENNQHPIFSLEASFTRTILNFGFRMLYFIIAIFILLVQQRMATTILSAFVVLGFIIKINSMYFTIKFYDDYLYIQKGFITSFANKFSLTYRCLIKMEIFDGDFDYYSSGTVFQLNYYAAQGFSKKIAYCSAITVPQNKIVDLLRQKKVAILLSS